MTEFATISAIADDDVIRFELDGAVRLRGLLDERWIERLRGAVDRVTANPGPMRETYSPDRAGHFFSEKFLWTFDADFRAYVFDSPVAAAAGRLMRARKVNFFYDHLLVKEPGTEAPTGWHQDQNYWPFSGRDICSIWAPLDAVDRHNGTLEFVAGSHRWHDRPMTRKPLFGRRPGQPQDLADADAAAVDDGPPQPDIEADRGAYRILCWDLEPGDAVAFTGMTLHYASANPGRGRRRALSTRWLGDDIRFLRKQRMLQMIREPGLRTGDAVDCELFPAVWQRDGA